MVVLVEESMPFRWDLVTPDQLGSLLDDTRPPDLWCLDALVECAGKVLARSGNGDLVFVGRSQDSMFDLLGGALAGLPDRPAVDRLPLSFERDWTVLRGFPGARRRPLTPGEQAQARLMLAALGVTPRALARRHRPVSFVDIVHFGSTFTELYQLLRRWIDEERCSWSVIRRKLRFVGVASRGKTSPNAYRWQQHAAWNAHLPARSVCNVSLDYSVWEYFASRQVKLNRTYRPQDWLAGSAGPDRDADTRQALAQAVAIVAYGRSAAGRQALARATRGEPALDQPWLRSLVTRLNGR